MTDEALTERRQEAAARLKQRLRVFRARANHALAAKRSEVADVQRLAFHLRHQEELRAGRRTRDQHLFAHGSNAEVGSYLDVDQYALRGLEANFDLYVLWLAQAFLMGGATTRAEALRIIFSDPDRNAYCIQEGLAVSWNYASALRAAETAEFRVRDDQDPRKRWRNAAVTERQLWDIRLIEDRLGISAPARLRRGTAHDWIELHGGHPDFWNPPPRPLEWKLPGANDAGGS